MLERDLECRLREAAPLPDAETADRLDARVDAARAGAGAPARGRRQRGAGVRVRFTDLRWRPAVGALGAIVVAAVLAVSAVRSANDTGSSGSDASSSGVAAQPADGAGSVAAAGPADPALQHGRRVERAATIRIGVPRVEESANEAMAVADRFGGLVMNTNIQTGADEPSPTAELELRVPTEQLGRALAALSRLGEVRERTQSSADVTAQYRTAATRLVELRAERRSLLTELGRATDAGTRAAVRRQLATNRVRLQRAAGERQRVDRTARLARIDVTLEQGEAPSGSAARDTRWGLGDAVRDAGRILAVAGAALVLAAAVLVPAGIVALLLALGARRVRRWRREHVLDAA